MTVMLRTEQTLLVLSCCETLLDCNFDDSLLCNILAKSEHAALTAELL